MRLRHRIEHALARALWSLCRRLGPDRASALGGRLARLIGPWTRAHRTAMANLRRALPELSEGERRAVLAAMWDNLGRVAAEYPHLLELTRERVELVGREHIERLRDDGRPGIFFSAHYGNWELAPMSAVITGLPPVVVYRPMNNPLVDDLVRDMRAVAGSPLVAKWGGGRELARILRKGGHIAMLVDQKENEGIPVPFLGRPAMTAPALAVFALAYDCPVVPARVERLAGCRFRISVEPPLELPRTGDRERDVAALMTAVNARIESWIRARPEQWFWVHRRWPDDA